MSFSKHLFNTLSDIFVAAFINNITKTKLVEMLLIGFIFEIRTKFRFNKVEIEFSRVINEINTKLHRLISENSIL